MFKKILASALAVAMLAGMSVTAFAAPSTVLELNEGDLIFAANKPAGISTNFDVPDYQAWFIVDQENIVEDVADAYPADIKALQAGDKIATPLIKVTAEADASDSVPTAQASPDVRKSDVTRWKTAIIWQTEEGEDLVAELTIEPLMLNLENITGAADRQLYYCATIEIEEDVEVDMADFVGRMILYKTSKSNYVSEIQLNADMFATRGYGAIGFDDSGFEEIYAEGFNNHGMSPSNQAMQTYNFPVRNFDAADANDRASMYFVGVGYYHTRVIDTEGDKYMAFNTVPNMEIEEANPKAHIDYVNFPGNVKFHQFGVMELFMEEGQYIYAMEDGMICTLEDFAKMQRENQELIYDEDDLTVSFQMNNYPETFIYSDMELVMEEEVVEEAEKEIPETGGVLAE